MKKIVSAFLTAALAVSMLVGCGSGNAGAGAGTEGGSAAEATDLKIGVILVGDETETYTKAHIDGINEAADSLGIPRDNIQWKERVEESEDCYDAAKALIADGCTLVISNSYGHQDFMAEAAEEFSDVNFVAMTGDYAAISGLDNFYNAFTNVYESRYVSGVVAGMKVAELDAAGEIPAEG
ncbi:MAG: BMP family ABC transporter substrate-binding protein, partial [Agathobacter sp.]|nr:BMP family ABC transporter substrate-binding protein [Agathobacter sp.]